MGTWIDCCRTIVFCLFWIMFWYESMSIGGWWWRITRWCCYMTICCSSSWTWIWTCMIDIRWYLTKISLRFRWTISKKTKRIFLCKIEVFVLFSYVVSDWCECSGVTSNERRSMGEVCRPIRSLRIIIGVGRISFSASDWGNIFDNRDRRLFGDSRKAKKSR